MISESTYIASVKKSMMGTDGYSVSSKQHSFIRRVLIVTEQFQLLQNHRKQRSFAQKSGFAF